MCLHCQIMASGRQVLTGAKLRGAREHFLDALKLKYQHPPFIGGFRLRSMRDVTPLKRYELQGRSPSLVIFDEKVWECVDCGSPKCNGRCLEDR